MFSRCFFAASAIGHDYGLHLDVSRDYKKSSDFSESLPFEPLAEKEMEMDEGEGHFNERCPRCLAGGGGRGGRR